MGLPSWPSTRLQRDSNSHSYVASITGWTQDRPAGGRSDDQGRSEYTLGELVGMLIAKVDVYLFDLLNSIFVGENLQYAVSPCDKNGCRASIRRLPRTRTCARGLETFQQYGKHVW